jgi:hypothetical protein
MKKTISWMVIVVLSMSLRAAGESREHGRIACQILDVPLDSVYQGSVGFAPSSSLDDYGDVSMLELEGYWGFARFWDILAADVDLAVRAKYTSVSGSTAVDLPSHLVRISLDAGCAWRFGGGFAAQLKLYPGLYSDFQEFGSGAWNIPFSVGAILAVNPRFSEMIGLEIRPGFRKTVMPLLGVVWAIDDRTRLDIRVPESRFLYYLGQGWSTHLGFKWENLSFAVDEGDYRAGIDRVTLEDFRLFGGVTWQLSDDLRLTGEIGRVFGRSIEFDEPLIGTDSDFDIGSATFLKFTLGGPF